MKNIYTRFKNLQRSQKISILIALSILIIYPSHEYWKNYRDPNKIIAHGNVDIRDVDLGFRVSGRISEMRFEEGDLVKKGDILATLDKVPYENEIDSKKALVAQAEAELLKKRTGNRPEEIKVAESILNERKAALENAVRTYERQKDLVGKGATSKQAYDDAVRQRDEATARVRNATETFDLIKEGFRKEDIQAAEAALELAKANLASAQTNLDDTQLHAPTNGIIFSRVREPGAIVAAGSSIYTLSLHDPVWIRAYISELNLGHVKPGMEATVTTDSTSKPFKGKLSFISPQAEFTPKTVATPELRTDLVYRIRVLVDDPEGELRQGMPVDVTIVKGTPVHEK